MPERFEIIRSIKALYKSSFLSSSNEDIVVLYATRREPSDFRESIRVTSDQ